MTRNKRILSNDRTTKARKNKVESIEAIRCEKLLQILQDRSSRLTDTSLEGIYNFYASKKLNDDDFLTILEATVKVDLQEAEKAITTSVEKVTENLNMMRVTKKHLLLVPRFKTPASVNFEYHYEECYQKKSDVKTIILKRGGSQISGFSVTLEKLLAFNDSVTMSRCQSTKGKVVVLTNQQSMHTSRANTVSPACK